jgi:hypothetical protein
MAGTSTKVRAPDRSGAGVERLADLVHRLAREGAELEQIVTTLLADADASMAMLGDVLVHCVTRPSGDSLWRRSAAAVQVAMGTSGSVRR